MTGKPSSPRSPATASRAAGRWGDLGVRVVSGLALAGLGSVSVAAGGWVFVAMTVFIFALMAWELAALSDQPTYPALRAAIALLAGLGLALAQASGFAVVALALAPLALALTPRRDRALIAVYSLAVLLSAHVFIALDHRGAVIVVWLVCIVVASDVFGYFAGRLFGGPKVWPAISPKKTWSGTVAGWVGAALVGLGFVLVEGGGWGLVPISSGVAMASQLGDMVESLIKRRAGVKDASRLVPGHGGVIDRFDALIGAILAVWVLELIVPLPLGGGL
ncbi:MAG: phosphatidate cytidylyltransferase [Pseudomonadota bacterium]